LDSSILFSFVLGFSMSKQKKLDSQSGFRSMKEASEALARLLEPEPRPRRRSPARHGRKCNVCNHPDREAIEQAFLHWQSPEKIARAFGIKHHSTVYRHAYATGLTTRRSLHTRHALDYIIEQAGVVRVTGDDVIKAIRAACCLTDDGKWVEPPRKCIITHRVASESPSKASATSSAVSSFATPVNGVPESTPPKPTSEQLLLEFLIANPRRLENDATH
jgi:hypothetical protein